MKFNTKINGVIEYEEKDILSFKHGLPGFETLNKFVLVKIEESPFNILHSVEDETVGLVVINPFDFIKDYELKLPEEVIKDLDINTEEEVLVLNTVTLNSDIKNLTTNLRAPIIINLKNNLGYQLILDGEKYSIKHPLNKE